MSTQTILDKLNKVRGGKGQYRAQCPAHGSDGLTLSIKEAEDGSTLLHCFAGCTAFDVMDALGLSHSEMFPDTPYERTGPSKKEIQQKQYEEMFIEIYKSDVSRGVKPSDEDKATYRQLISKRYRGAA